jgi:hypothetical protein
MMNHDQEIPSKFHFWYVTCPGYTESAYDNDIHYISGEKLLVLYRIPPPLRAQVWSIDEFQRNLRMTTAGGIYLGNSTLKIYGRQVLYLKPQSDGDYSWEKLVLSTVLETL